MTSTTIPILCYHAIEAGRGPLCLPPESFRGHVDALLARDAVTLTVADVASHIRSGQPFPDNAVALTFDDAVESVHSEAFPVLESAGFVATVFAVTGHVGGHAEWNGPNEWPEFPLMGCEALHSLHQAGWEIGSHSHTHRRLTELAPDDLKEELHLSAELLADLVDTPTRSFAYPYGANDGRTRSMAAEVYEASVTIGARRASLTTALDAIDRIDAWYFHKGRHVARLDSRITDLYLAIARVVRALRRID